jgi:hypothetical protein
MFSRGFLCICKSLLRRLLADDYNKRLRKRREAICLKEGSNGLPELLDRELPFPERKIGVHVAVVLRKKPPRSQWAVYNIAGHMELYENRDREDAKGRSIH